MKRVNRSTVQSLILVTVVLAGSGIGLAPAGARTAAAKPVIPASPHGINLIIKTSQDPNFCIQDTTSATGSPLEVSACAVLDAQHWTFAQATDNSTVLVDGDGECLGFVKSSTDGVVTGPCSFNGSERLVFTISGQIENRARSQCLQYLKSAQNAGVFVTKCVAGSAAQTFMLAK